jgi:hypothetical protein
MQAAAATAVMVGFVLTFGEKQESVGLRRQGGWAKKVAFISSPEDPQDIGSPS